MSEQVVIIGSGFTHKECVFGLPNRSYWAQNAMHRLYPAENFDLWFQLHIPGSGEGHIDDEDHREFLATTEIPVVVQSIEFAKELKIKNYVVYPLEEVILFYCPDDVPYFTNSIDYMLCYALYAAWQSLALYGIEFISNGDEEYYKMRQSCEYYVGLARGFGKQVFIPKNAALCKAEYQYGWETKPVDEMLEILNTNNTKISTELSELQQKKIEIEAQIHMLSGGLQVVKQLIDVVKMKERGMQL